MSYILDALERSRREHTESAPPLPVPQQGQTPAAPASFPWVALLSAALGVALVLLAWLWWSNQAVSPSPHHAGPPAAQAPLAPPQPLPLPQRSAAATPATGPATAPPVIDSATAAADVRALYRDASTVPEPAPVKEPAVQESASQEPAVQQPAVEEAPVASAPGQDVGEGVDPRVDALVAEAEAALENRGLKAHAAPMLAELSQNRRDEIPTLMYLQHDYRGAAGESSVLINRQRCREGDSVSGVEVQEILADSVVLNHRGTVFRLRALNSWVNL